MTGIITDNLKRLLLDQLITDVASPTSSYYVGIGNSIDWDSSDTPPDPINSVREERNLRLRLQSIKSSEDVSYVIPRNNWTAGTIYSGWDDNVSGQPATPYFIITEDNAVYMCLKQGRDSTGAAVASTITPTGASTSSFVTADGYTWKFLYTLSAGNASKFLSANYVPVSYIESIDSASPAAIIEQYNIQQAAVPGQIGSIRVVSGGTGYVSAPTVTIIGDGDSCTATAVVSGGAVVDIKIDSDGAGNVKHGSGYTKATAVFGSGTATARVTLGPLNGFGANCIHDLRAKAVMFNTKPSGDESGTFITDNDFRQVALIKNPKITATDSDYTGASNYVLNTLTFASVGTAFSIDKTILGATSGAKAYVDTYNNTSKVMYYHQTEDTGFKSFTNGETINETNGSGVGTLDSAAVPGVGAGGYIDWTSGDILYIENRAAIARAVDQTEDIKIVIQL